MKISIIIISAVMLFTAGCENSSMTSDPNRDIEVRAVLESEVSNTGDLYVYVEGADGNELTGAVVLVSDSQNRVKKLSFNPDEYCYNSPIPLASDGTYTIRVDSQAADEAVILEVPHTILNVKPVLTSFQDADGNSVLSGQDLASNSEFQTAWNSTGSGVVYQVSIKTALRTIYSVSTEACNIIIPASTIPAGTNYYFDIVAQKIYGDPFFITDNFYSVSVIRSASVAFNVK